MTIRTTSWHPDDLGVRPVQVPGDHFKSTVESFNHVNINIRAKQFEITISSIEVAYFVGLLPPANEVCEGYVFTLLCLSTGGSCMAGGHAWQGGLHGGGVHGGRGHPW